MPKRKWSRTQQMWVIIVLCISIFGVSIALIPEVTRSIYWKVMLAAAIACGLFIVLFEVWLLRVVGRRDMATTFLDRITSGVLSLSVRGIREATRSELVLFSLLPPASH